MIRVTLDTNVLISGTFWSGDSFQIMKLIDEQKVLCILSKETIEEYNRVLHSDEIVEKIENKNLVISKTIRKVLVNAVIVEPKKEIKIVKDDPDDDKFIEAAVEGKSDYIISSDKHLLDIRKYKNVKIVTPKEFLRVFS